MGDGIKRAALTLQAGTEDCARQHGQPHRLEEGCTVNALRTPDPGISPCRGGWVVGKLDAREGSGQSLETVGNDKTGVLMEGKKAKLRTGLTWEGEGEGKGRGEGEGEGRGRERGGGGERGEGRGRGGRGGGIGEGEEEGRGEGEGRGEYVKLYEDNSKTWKTTFSLVFNFMKRERTNDTMEFE